MCDPITIAGLALTAGSTVANSIAQGKAQKARDDALAAERIRQGALNNEAAAINAGSVDRYGNFQTDQAAKSNDLASYFQGMESTAPAAADLPPTSSNIVTAEVANQKGKADAFGNQQDQALASLRSFGDVLGSNSRLDARDASKVGMIGGFKRGSSSVLPYELEAANSKGAGLRLLGDVLGGAGSIATGVGLQGKFVSPGTTTGTLVKPLVPAYAGGPSVSLQPRTILR